MVKKDALDRLAQLNRGELKNVPGSEKIEPEKTQEKSIPQGKQLDIVQEPALAINRKRVDHIPLEEAAPGKITRSEDGEFLLLKWKFKDLRKNAKKTVKQFPVQLAKLQNANAENENIKGFDLINDIHPSKILFLDIETCGLSASPLFLIGVAYFTGEDFILLQLFARDYSEEKPLLAYFKDLFSQYDLLVTFNGKSFDYPFILNRGIENDINFQKDKLHIDLLHEVRKRWSRKLPNCKLQTVEKIIYDRRRIGDIPGSEIPQVYREFVRTGNAALVKSILEHNVLDIITLIDIVISMSEEISV
ncbi:ribonuclease H-like domain-containing protein [candidate division KSB1 bacterium]